MSIYDSVVIQQKNIGKQLSSNQKISFFEHRVLGHTRRVSNPVCVEEDQISCLTNAQVMLVLADLGPAV